MGHSTYVGQNGNNRAKISNQGLELKILTKEVVPFLALICRVSNLFNFWFLNKHAFSTKPPCR